MKALVSVRLSEPLIHSLNQYAHALHLSQTEYIRQAIELMNREVERKKRVERLVKASLRVRKESMKINAEFSEIEHDPKG